MNAPPKERARLLTGRRTHSNLLTAEAYSGVEPLQDSLARRFHRCASLGEELMPRVLAITLAQGISRRNATKRRAQ